MQKIIKGIAVVGAVVLARILPFNIIIGSVCSFFSGSSVFAPVVASQCGLGWVACFLITTKIFQVKSLWLFLLHRLPLCCSSVAFVKASKAMNLLLPMVCIVLFIVHPVGGNAWLYAMYWLIPMFLYFITSNLFVRSLQASFIAHAVGSVIWLYTGSISAKTWLSLIPVVVVERLMIALGMMVTYSVCTIFVEQIMKLYQKQIGYKVMQ